MNRSKLRIVAIIFGVLFLLVALVGGFVWWKLAGLKSAVVNGLEVSLNAKVDVASNLDLDIWKGELRAAGITLTNNDPTAPWTTGSISQATVHFHLLDLLSSPMPLTVHLSSWNLALHPVTAIPGSAEAPATGTQPATATAATAPEPAKSSIQVTELSVEDGTVTIETDDNRKVDLEGVTFDSTDNGAGLWTTHLQTSSIKCGSLEAEASSVLITSKQDNIMFSELHMACGQGLIAGTGNIDLGGDHKAQASLQATDIPVSMLVSTDWQMKVSGLATGDLNYEGNELTSSAKGKISLESGKFNLLPWLGKVTALVGLPDIMNVELDKATADYEWKDHVLHLTDLDVRKDGVTRLGGSADIDGAGHLDAKLKLGLPTSATSKWPALQDKVFSTQYDDFNWADVHVWGTADHLEEDLTSRVLAVGVDQGTGLLNTAAQKAGDLWNALMGK